MPKQRTKDNINKLPNEFDSPIRESERMMPKPSRIDFIGIFLMGLIVFITAFCYPKFNSDEKPTIHEVFYYGWITAISTGLGVVPFLFFRFCCKLFILISFV